MLGVCKETASCALVGAILTAGCGAATDPPTSSASAASSSVAGAGAVLRTFSVIPTAITDGDSFELRWEGENGVVSLARKGEPPFAVGLAATGSRELQPATDGYPAGPGETVYVAVIGDLAQQLEATITVQASATPTPTPTATPSPCGDGKCSGGEDCSSCPQDCGCNSAGAPHCCNGVCSACCDSSHCGGCQVCASNHTCVAVSCDPCYVCDNNHGCRYSCGAGSCCNGSCCSGDCCGGTCCSGKCCGGTCYPDGNCCTDADCDTACYYRPDGAAMTRFCNAANNHRCQDQFCTSKNGSWDSCCDGQCSADPCF